MPAGRNPGYSGRLWGAPGSHGEDDCPGLEGKDAVVGVDGGYGPIRRDVQHHGVELVGDLPLFYLRDKAAAYSGPVNSSLKVWSPKPLWMH